MRIRNVQKNDFFRFSEMNWNPLPRERDSIYLTICTDHTECSFIAEDEDGSFQGVLLATRSADGGSLYLNHIYVNPTGRGKGVGGHLMDSFEEYAREKDVGRIWFFCEGDLVAWYAERGYRETYDFLTPEIEKYLHNTKKVHAMILEL